MPFRHFLIVGLWIAFACQAASLYVSIGSFPEHADEPFWVESSYFYKLFFVDRDYANPDWDNFISYDQPPIGRYVLGAATLLGGGDIEASMAGVAGWYRYVIESWFKPPLETRLTSAIPGDAAAAADMLAYSDSLLGQLPPAAGHIRIDDFAPAREAMFFFGILSAALIGLIAGKVADDAAAGPIAGLALISSPITVPGFEQAMPDALWCFFALLCLLSLSYLARAFERDGGWKAICLLSLAAGASLSLAIGTKLTAAYMAAVTVLVSAAAAALAAIRSRRNGLGASKPLILGMAGLAIAASSALAIFILPNPFLYRDPIGGIAKMADHRERIMQIQSASQWPALDSFQKKATALYRYGILSGYHFEGPAGKLLELAYLALFVLGLWRIGRACRSSISSRRLGFSAVAVIWILATYAIVGPAIHMQWERYFLPLAMCDAVILGSGAVEVARRAAFCYNDLRMKRPSRQRGFTLIELMVVISIIGLLSSVVLATLSSAKIRARNATIISNTHQAAIALESYYTTYGTYPNPASATGALCIGATTCACPAAISYVCGSTLTDQITMAMPGSGSSAAPSPGSFWDYALFAPQTALAATYSGYGILTGQTLQDPLVYYCSYATIGQCPEGYEWILYPQYAGTTASNATWLNISPVGAVTNFSGGAE